MDFFLNLVPNALSPACRPAGRLAPRFIIPVKLS